MCGFSLKKSAWELELSKCITFKLYPSLDPAGMILLCGDSHMMFVLCALLYWRQPSPPAVWGKKALKCKCVTWKCCLVQSRAQEVRLRWHCCGAARRAALRARGALLTEAWQNREGRTQRLASENSHYQQQICISTEPSSAAALLPDSKKDSLTKLFGVPSYSWCVLLS